MKICKKAFFFIKNKYVTKFNLIHNLIHQATSKIWTRTLKNLDTDAEKSGP